MTSGLLSSLVLSTLLVVAAPPVDAPGLGHAGERAEPVMVGPGLLTVYVFDVEGQPLAGVVVEAADRQGVTDDAGRCQLSVLEGAYEVRLLPRREHQEAQAPVVTPSAYVAGGLETEVFVTLRPAGALPLVDVEAPPPPLLPPFLPPLLGDEGGRGEAEAPSGASGPPRPTSVGRGRIAGRLVSVEDGTPVEGARVLVRGEQSEAVSDASGRFALRVPAGTWAISVVHPKFAGTVQDGIVVEPGQVAEVTVELTPAAFELEAFTVTAPHVAGSVSAALDEKRKASSITEVLGAAEMGRSGDSDAAGALRRVTGVTVVGGRYVYVRGLGERYSSTLLNGAGLPSPEPERRVVPLDLFPTSVLESVVIHKTYTPDLPGEFGGGTVELRTRSYPEEFLLKVSGGAGALTGTTLRQGLMSPGGLLDVVGIDDGTRALDPQVAAASQNEQLKETDRFSDRGYTASELEKLGERFPNVWTPRAGTIMPDVSLNAEAGDRFELGPVTFGYLGGASYGNDWQRLAYRREYLLVGSKGLESGHRYDFESLENRVRLGGVFTTGFEVGEDHQVKSTTLLGRTTTNESRVYEGLNRDVGADIRVARLRFVERTLLAEQVAGKHRFPFLWDLAFDWRYTYALALRHEPDRREVRYDNEPGTDRWLLSDRPEGNQRFFSDLTDHNHDLGGEVTWPFTQWNGLEGLVKAGAALNLKSRVVDTRRFKYQHKGPRSGDSEVLAQDPESIFVPANIGADGFQLEEITRETDNYDASQVVGGAFVLGDLPVWNGIRLAGGVRIEGARQHVRTYQLFNPDSEPVEAELLSFDVLPGGALTLDLEEADWLPSWRVLNGMKLRAAGSLTVSRPDFRELSPATFNDVTGGRQTYGNPDLVPARIAATDVRWEWYPVRGTSLAAAVFYKHFWSPIEQIVVVSAQHSITYANALAADNVGAELELRTDLGFVHPLLSGLYAAGNGAVIYSQVTLDEQSGIQTSKARPLQGQSPWVVNVQAGYDNAERGLRATVLYNVYGPRISSVGALGVPDQYEQPFHRVDLVFQQELAVGVTVGLKAENLLDLPAVQTQGGVVTESIRYGRSLGASLGWSF